MTLTPAQVAERLGVHAESVYQWIADGSLPAVDVSRRPGVGRATWRVAEADLAAFLDRRRSKASKTPPGGGPAAEPVKPSRRAKNLARAYLTALPGLNRTCDS